MSQQKRLFLLDAYALIFRGYYAFIKNPRINSKGLNTSAVMGFMNSLLDVIKREKPDHLAVAFDKGGSDFRNEMFAAYKANRDETPEAIRIAVPYIQKILEAMTIPVIEKAGFEADDLIGTLAKQAEKEGYQVFMVTPDKDFAQLVSENIFMYRPARMGNGIEIWGIPEVQAKFEIENPLQVIDFLAMMGDAVDNIPGLPGVGEVTAKKLLKEFGSIENLLENTDKLKGKLKENVENNKEKGLMSKKLATILLDCPVTFHEQDFEMAKPKFDQLNALFDELEFRRIKEQFEQLFANHYLADSPATAAEVISGKTSGKATDQMSLFGENTVADSPSLMNSTFKNIQTTPHLYQTIDSEFALKILVDKLLKQTEVCFDTETTGLDPLVAKLVGIAFSWEKGKGYYVAFPDDQAVVETYLKILQPFFDSENILKIGQNLKYDLKVLAKHNVTVCGKLFDTMLAHYLINPDMRHNMDVLAETYLNYSPVSITELIGKKGKNQLNMREIDLSKVTEYAAEDADITLQLKAVFTKMLDETATRELFEKVEIPILKVLADMEITGISLDKNFLKSLSKNLDEDIIQLEKDIYQQAGTTFNLASPKQLGTVLFEQLKLIEKPKKTKTGQYATGEEVLSYLAPKHEIVQNILDWRQLIKLKNTYVDTLPEQVNPQTGRIHTEYMQTVAATGRLSSNNPNLQNIPIRTERGREVRKAFVAKDENHVLLAADYSQIELRIIAALSGDPSMIASFKNGEDIHKSTASKVFGVPLEEVTREQRSHAKTVNFGIIYGVSAFGLSQQTDLSRSDSKNLIDTYYATYPKLRDYIQSQIDFAHEHGYVKTILGRRRYLPDIQSQNQVVRGAAERNAVNAPIQGSAADIIKLAMIQIFNQLNEKHFKTKMLLQVHDELVFEVPKNELETVSQLIKKEMESAYILEVPLSVDLGVGNNWLEAH
ncbi:MAG: DNA polymerase I [Flavobacteriaceae bacterium]|nr:DNA polymerase I [Flavobacteriaceae bacterium]MDZ4147117.1 DNA polymerase I [Flavobacteriaceae bacterium]